MPINVLEKAKSKGVHLSVVEGRLKVRAKQGALDDELRQEITQAKELLIELLSEIQVSERDRNSEAIKRVPRDPAGLPLSLAQERLWFIDRHEASSSQYNIPSALTLSGALNKPALQRALDVIVERHEVLRTTYAEVHEVGVQVINPAAQVAIREIDLSKLAGAAQADKVAELVRVEANTAFDLTKDLMLRVSLLELSATEHVLLFTMHHIASDGWSVGVLTREFVALYAAFCAGRENPLAPLEIQYADFSHWQRQNLSNDSIAAQLAYWEKQLAGIPAVHRLPLDRARPAEQNFAGRTFARHLDKELNAQLNRLAQEQGATLFMLLESAFALLLARWSHEDDIVIGTPIAGRTHSQLEPLIGFFVNTLVFRHQLHAEQSFIQLLAEARQKALDAYANQDVSFQLVVDKVQPKRSLSHSPLFQVLFALQNNEQASLDLPHLSIGALAGGQETTKFDLELAIGESDAGLSLNWTYARSLFDASTIERISQSFEVLLRSIVAAPATAIYELDLSTDAEKDRQLAVLRQGAGNSCAETLLHHLFEQQVIAQPDARAVIFADSALSYRELNERANQVAHWLIEKGVGPDTVVGLCVERSLEMVIGILAVWKAGGAYLPIDPNYPRSRIEYILRDSAIGILLTDSRVAGADQFEVGARLVLDDSGKFAALPTRNPDVAGLSGSNLAYVIYTSGSTGTPKGVCIEHRSLSHLSQHLDKITAAPRTWAWLASYVFDASLQGLTRLGFGGCLLVLDDRHKVEIERLERTLAQHPVDIIDCTPSIVESWLDQNAAAKLPDLLIGGEAISPALWQRLDEWQREYRRVAINVYGPTECCVDSTWTVVAGDVPHIGKALGDTALCVLSSSGRPLPMGVPGELHIGGVGLARGYFNRPELTAQRFVEFACADQAAVRLYKTGDIVRWLGSGNLEFLGRSDDQVKIRGFRIELGEIEQQLNRLDAVRASAVLAVDGEANQKRLVAYVVPAQPLDDTFGEPDFVGSLRQSLEKSLAAYMVPSAFKVLPKLPLTANGKLDKRSLSLLDTPAQFENLYAAPRNTTEARLCEIWQAILRVETVGIHDNFFQLGGDSILSIQVVARANKAGIPLTTRQLFASQTIAELALAVANESVVVQAPQHAIQGGLELLPIQRGFFAASDANVHHFNQSVLLLTPAEFDADALKTIVAALLKRHDALRLCFERAGESWSATHRPLTDELVDACCVTERVPADIGPFGEYLTQRCENHQRAIDIGRGPLLRAVHFEGAESGRLLLVAHHLVVDGVSWRILLADMEQAYRSYRNGHEVSLAPKTSAFQQWGAALADYARSEAVQQEQAYWRAQSSAPIAPLPMDFKSNRAPQRKTSEVVRIELSVEETARLLTQCSAAYRTNINELLLSGVYLGMRRWTRSPRLKIVLEGHGREELFERLDTTETVGWFTTTYPLMLECDEDNIPSVIRNIKEQYRSIPHKGIGYGVLRHLAADPILAQAEKDHPAQLSFNYLGQFDQTFTGESIFGFAPESRGTDVDPERPRDCTLELNGMVAQGRLHFELSYSAEQFKHDTAQKLAGYIEDELRAIIAHCTESGAANPAVDAGVLTPSDFPLARVSAAQLREWQGRYEIEQLYPATSMQQGMLFHTMLDAGAYVSQIYPTFSGRLDADCFRRAWQAVVDRHDIFRTVFVGEGEHVHQLVVKSARIPWHEEDLRSLSEAQQAARFEAFRQQDKALGFDVSQAPMQRISVFQLADDRFKVLWSSHHMLLDGWSTPLVYRDVMAAYQALLNDQPIRLPAVAPYSNYIAWLQAQDRDAAADYWRKHLSDLRRPTPLVLDRLPGDGKRGHQSQSIDLSRDASDKLRTFAERSHTTVNTVVQLAWGLLLHRYSGDRSVVFGATISGRPAAVADVESMVGLFINTIPVKLSFDESDVASLLSTLHQSFQDSNDFGYLPLTEIQFHSEVPNGVPLFDSLIAFENFPIDAAGDASADASSRGLAMEGLGADEQTNYKLTLVATLQEVLTISCRYRGEDFSELAMQHMLQQLVFVLTQLLVANSVQAIDLPEDEFHVEVRRIAAALAASRASDAAPQSGAEHGAHATLRPRSRTETDMLQIWQQVLGAEIPSIRDNFFDLGGNSLKAMRVANQIAAHFKVEKSLKALFVNSTVESLSAYVDGQRKAAAQAIPSVDKSVSLPLSFAQQRLWVVDQMNGGGAHYNMPVALRLRGELDRQALHQSLTRIVERHAVLRTVYVSTETGPVQLIRPASELELPVIDLSGLQRERQTDEVLNQVRAEAAAVFDLGRDSMLRVRLLVLHEREHVLLLTMHHIASDGWSIGILTREFVALYQAYRDRTEAILPELEIQYADYAHWQRATFSTALEAQWRHWQQVLQGAPALHALPLDKPRPAQQKFAGAVYAQVIERSVLAELDALGKRHDATLFMVLQSAFALLLSRWSGERDIVLGSPVAGRTQKQVENLIGFFVNTVVFRHDVAPAKRFADLLAESRKQALEAFANQDITLEMIVERLQVERSLAYNPVVQVMFSLQNQDMGELRLPGLEIEGVGQTAPVAKFDLDLDAQELNGELHLVWRYATSLFEPATIERMAHAFAVLLRAIAADATAVVADLPLLEAPQRAQVIEAFNDTAVDFRSTQLIHRLFEQQAAAQPDADAVAYEQQRLTYAELNARANRLAHCLMARGVKPEDRVGVCVERGIDLVVALLGVLKAGAAYVPLDPSWPAARVAYSLRDSAPAALLAQQATRALLVEAAVPVISLDAPADAALLAQQSEENPDARAMGLGADNLAYVIYTSGSTGAPQGVMIEHRSVVNLWSALNAHLRDDAGGTPRRVALNASVAFDASVVSLVQLASGACIVVVPQAVRSDGAALLRYIEQQRIELLEITPAQLQLLVAEGFLDANRHVCRRVVVGGDTIPARLSARLADATAITFYNVYGPTECTVGSTLCPVRHAAHGYGIGRPLANTRVYVLDENRAPVPIGVTGELYIGGEGVARGYLGRDELTAERFPADPFVQRPGARMYKTGDLGSWCADGSLRYHGRNDFQVKIRGFRIELPEIEASLSRCAGVREAAVVVRSEHAGEKSLVAYVVLEPGRALHAAELRVALGVELPEYMLPSTFVALDALPKTPSDKLDRNALPAPDRLGAAAHAYAAPRGEREQTLARIWQALFGLERVGRDDNFFDIGGNSVRAIQTVMQAKKAGLEIKIGDVFKFQTIAGICAADGAAESGSTPDAGAARTLSPYQRSVLDSLDQDGAVWHFRADLAAGMTETHFRHMIREMVAKFPALGHVAIKHGASYRLKPAENLRELLRAAVEVHDVSAVPADALSGHIEATRKQQDGALAALDGPLLRASLFVGAASSTCALNVHRVLLEAGDWESVTTALRDACATGAQ